MPKVAKKQKAIVLTSWKLPDFCDIFQVHTLLQSPDGSCLCGHLLDDRSLPRLFRILELHIKAHSPEYNGEFATLPLRLPSAKSHWYTMT